MKTSALAMTSLAAIVVCVSGAASQGPTSAAVNRTLTAVAGIKVGHFTLAQRPTGCTVVLIESPGAIASVSQRGGAPATRETDLLDPANDVQMVNAIVLAGGSAYGLDAASGTVAWLDERQIGHPVGPAGVVPIVPAAALIDLWFGGDPKIRPGRDCGYRAADAASTAPVAEGNVGAGAGATVGKTAGLVVRGNAGPMKAGIGSAAIIDANGLVVAAIVAVNARGDVIDPMTGRVVAGVRGSDGKLADARKRLRAGDTAGDRGGANTTIGVIATNAALTKVQARKVAEMAHDGYARAISPIHTPADGDTIFSVATGRWTGDAGVATIGSLAAEVMAEAVVRAATQARASHGLPSAGDLGTIPARFRPPAKSPSQR